MRVAYLLPSLERCGPVTMVHTLIRALQPGMEITVYYFRERADRPRHRFPVPTRRIALWERLPFERYDLIHSHGLLPDLYLRLHRAGAKRVTTFHNFVEEDLRRRHGKMMAGVAVAVWQWATRRHDHIVVVSGKALEYYRGFWKNGRMSRIYNGVDESPGRQVKRAATLRRGRRIGVIASAGGAGAIGIKGVDRLIRALPALPEYSVDVAGALAEDEEHLRALARELGVSERVAFRGYCPEISAFIREMDLCVVPSRTEGFSLALMEIVRERKPVVCSDIPVFRELFGPDEVTFFGGEVSLAEAILDAVERGAAKSERAYRRFWESYRAARMASDYRELYERLVGE